MAVHLLSLPGSTLVPSSDDQPHRINLCYRAPSYPANQRVWLTDRDFNHGFQTRYRSPETLAPTQRIRFAPKSGHRRPFYRWRGTARTSCLTVINRGCAFFPYTTFDNISILLRKSLYLRSSPTAPVRIGVWNWCRRKIDRCPL